MPCRDPRDEDRILAGDYVHKQRLDAATRAACEALTLLASFKGGYVSKLSGPTQSWWTRHQELDRRRKEAERTAANIGRLKASAVAKLTIEERKALGL